MNTSKSRLKRQERDRVTNHGCFIKKPNNKHSLFSSYLIDKCVIMKKEYYKNMSNKEKNKTERYNKYYLICTSTIVYYNYFYRQRQQKLETAAEETMACAKHSPQAQERLLGGSLAARSQTSCGRRISCHQNNKRHC